MNYERNERIRRAAILVASIDESLAEQMLDSLPAAEATKILAEVDRLGEIDPDEQRDVLAEFRRAGRREPESVGNGVEFTYSAPQAHASVEPALNAEPEPPLVDESAAAAEASLVAELLSAEHPQTIAVALSRMPHDQGAAVFAELTPPLQEEVLGRLANLQITDESAVLDLETELQQRIELQRQRRERAAAGAEMARRIVAKTAPSQRDTLLARITPTGTSPALPADAAPATLTDQQMLQLQAAIEQARQLVAAQTELLDEDAERICAWDDPADESDAVQFAFDPAQLEDRSRDLEQLSDAALLRALQAADERTVQLALACSSERFLRRVAAKLPRAAASRLRMAVRSIGPTRLGELRAAQHELLHLSARTTSRVAA
jgi:flagellar motor switch protein FliG